MDSYCVWTEIEWLLLKDSVKYCIIKSDKPVPKIK